MPHSLTPLARVFVISHSRVCLEIVAISNSNLSSFDRLFRPLLVCEASPPSPSPSPVLFPFLEPAIIDVTKYWIFRPPCFELYLLNPLTFRQSTITHPDRYCLANCMQIRRHHLLCPGLQCRSRLAGSHAIVSTHLILR